MNVYKFLSILLFIIGCQSPIENNEMMDQDSTIVQKDTVMDENNEVKYLALGDSYTIGESVMEVDRWPYQLASNLQKDQVPILLPKIIAKTGWTTDELKQAIATQNPSSDYDLVSLLIGVNNQYRGYNIEQYESEFDDLLKKSIELAGDRSEQVFVLSIPDYAVTPFAQNSDTSKISSEIDAYNLIAKKIADSYGVRYFDITGISRKAKSDASLIAEDGMHPSGKMYEEWVNLIQDEVKNMLNP
jgi:lysophospholipase L1-like esterase